MQKNTRKGFLTSSLFLHLPHLEEAKFPHIPSLSKEMEGEGGGMEGNLLEKTRKVRMGLEERFSKTDVQPAKENLGVRT